MVRLRLGQPTTQVWYDPRTWSVCDAPQMVASLPVVRTAVRQYGCHPAGRQAAQAALLTAPSLQTLALNVAIDCACREMGLPTEEPDAEPDTGIGVGTALLAAAAGAVAVAAVIVARRRRGR